MSLAYRLSVVGKNLAMGWEPVALHSHQNLGQLITELNEIYDKLHLII